jgi:hypothetical protein
VPKIESLIAAETRKAAFAPRLPSRRSGAAAIAGLYPALDINEFY